jgi:putative transposase
MCRVLGVSVSCSSNWHGRGPSRHAREDGEIAKEIPQIFPAHRGVYGSPQVQVELRERGMLCSRERTARIRREMDLASERRRTKPVGTKGRQHQWLRTCSIERFVRLHPLPHGSAIRPLFGQRKGGSLWR